MQISSENLSRCQNYATKVAQFVRKITLVISIIHNHNAKNIVNPNHLVSPKPVYLDQQCLQNMK